MFIKFIVCQIVSVYTCSVVFNVVANRIWLALMKIYFDSHAVLSNMHESVGAFLSKSVKVIIM